MQECIVKTRTESKRTTRAEKAVMLFKSGVRPRSEGRDVWTVEGSKGVQYEVRKLADGEFDCSCPDGLYRSHQGELCKHILLVLMALDEQQAIESMVLQDAELMIV
jgi:uncharacterized Zn finger protein